MCDNSRNGSADEKFPANQRKVLSGVDIDFQADDRYCMSLKGGVRDDRRTIRSAEPAR